MDEWMDTLMDGRIDIKAERNRQTKRERTGEVDGHTVADIQTEKET